MSRTTRRRSDVKPKPTIKPEVRIRIKIHRHPYDKRNRVYIDGHDVTRAVRGVSLRSHVNEIVSVSLELIPEQVDLSALVDKNTLKFR